MWDEDTKGTPDEKPRQIPVSKELLTALNQFCKDTGNPKQMVFSKACIKLLMRYTEDIDIFSKIPPEISFSDKALDDIECLMENNIMPGEVKRRGGKRGQYEHKIYVRFQSNVTFEWAQHLERLQKVNDTCDFIRRIFTWFLREKGYLPLQTTETSDRKTSFSFLHRADRKSKENQGQQHSAPLDQAQPSS